MGIYSVQEGTLLCKCLKYLRLQVEVNDVPSMQTQSLMALNSGIFKSLLGICHVYGGPHVMVALMLSRSVTNRSLAGTKK